MVHGSDPWPRFFKQEPALKLAVTLGKSTFVAR
jgi:hypothetical protein